MSTAAEDFYTFKRNTQQDIESLQDENRFFKGEIHNLRQGHIQLHEHCLQIQSRTMESNLIFVGIQETPKQFGQREIVEQTLRNCLHYDIHRNPVINASGKSSYTIMSLS